ncbi:zona pellucida sperm-binding protein 3-like [Cottoperca gobio]|uniref:Zona pellucida sperm-binding protein 3-like n=1 Tax=Cottoperca gobio TaxID=56716 RepID=A0A6J2QI75_COTGO|nr:zona pellucida sperm-binding protein 3-like [Cottoperca gobio]
MVTQCNLCVAILAIVATAVAYADIKVVCGKGSINITWKISAELVPHASRLFLGNCKASRLTVLPSGEGAVQFKNQLTDCKFKRVTKGKRLIYRNELTFRPHQRSKPATLVYPIECVYKRPEGWVPSSQNPGSSISEGKGGLEFHMILLNDQLTGVAKTNVIPLGSFMPIWAAVEQKSHQPLLLLIEECVAATTQELQPGSQVYPIIGNKGCLLESTRGRSVFLPRYHSSSIVVYLQSFKFGLGEEVYIHCKLVAWDPEVLDEGKKACHYVKENERWELLDDPSQSSICSCCSSTCLSRTKRGVELEPHGFTPNSVLGPLIIMDLSHPNAHNASVMSVTGADSQEAQTSQIETP